MSESDDAVAESVANDTSALDAEPSLILDEDRLGADPLEDGMDAADGYSRDVRLGGTREAEDQDSLAYRLPQEEPDPVQAEIDAEPPRPLAVTPIDDLDESVDEPDPAVDGVRGREDVLSPDGAVRAEDPAEAGGPVELGLDSAAGSNEPTGLPADGGIGAATPLDREVASAEEEALRIEQET